MAAARIESARRLLEESDRSIAEISAVCGLGTAEALRRGKDAAARASMTSGGWTQAESYRDLIKDKALAESLAQQGRKKSTGECLDQKIAEA